METNHQQVNIIKHHKTVNFKVYAGECKTCKKTIEIAVRKMNGVETVVWDTKRQSIEIVYDPMLTEPLIMKKTIVELGYDTDTLKATDEAYNLLEECCKYSRK